MKNLTALMAIFTFIVTANCFAQPEVQRVTLPKSKAMLNLDHPQVKSLESHFKAKGFSIKADPDDSDVFKGKDDNGDFEVEITTKTITKKGVKPVEITVITTRQNGITKTEVLAEDDDEQFREGMQNGRPQIMSTNSSSGSCTSSRMISCVGSAMQGASNCAGCFNKIKDCIRGKKRVSAKIFCVMTTGILGCLPCGLSIFEVVGCISECSASAGS